MKLFNQITLVGVGLLGGSLARVCRERGLVGSIVGFGRNSANLEQARELGVIDICAPDLSSAVENADLVVLCSPVGTIVSRVKEMLPSIKPGCIITDVGSVKAPLVRGIEALVPKTVHYVGSHPIAGGEKSGLAASSSHLFQNAKCIVTPTPQTDAEALARVSEFWQKVGMEVLTMNAEEHDYIFGAVSHLPHIVAYALMNTVGEISTKNYSQITSLSGQGFKDITRIAASDPVMWRDICVSNKEPVLTLIDEFQSTLQRLKTWIEKEDAGALEQTFEMANKYRFNLI
ncbi:MAG: prephenate dehydrogenase [Nitrospinaceae bacterium]